MPAAPWWAPPVGVSTAQGLPGAGRGKEEARPLLLQVLSQLASHGLLTYFGQDKINL